MRIVSLPTLALLAGFLAGCGKSDPPPAADPPIDTTDVVIGIVAKSQSNPVFQAARAGAIAAAIELGPAHHAVVTIDWRTPADEDPQKQAEMIELLARNGVKGIAVSCSDAGTLTKAIDRAVDLGANVMCFDSDAPASKRFCFFGTDDVACGRQLMRELAAAMGDKGVVAVLAGNQAAPNLQNRVKGVLEELKAHPQMSLLPDGVFYHPETPEQAAEKMNTAQSTNPTIGGWALVGGWPLFTRDSLHWEPGAVKVVSVDALPAQFPYLEDGHVDVLLAQNCFAWGYQSVKILLDKIEKGVTPPTPLQFDPLEPVRKGQAKEYLDKWRHWLGE